MSTYDHLEPGRPVNEEAEMTRSREAFHAQHRVVTKPGDDPYRGEYDCGDCCSMSHCETHHKTEGTYPFDSDDASLDRSTSQTDFVTHVLWRHKR